MKSDESKYIDRTTVEKMRRFYCQPQLRNADKNRRIGVLMKNLEQLMKAVAAEKKIVDVAAQKDFYGMVQEFFVCCKQAHYPLSYNLLNQYKKARAVGRRQTEAKIKAQAVVLAEPRVIRQEKEKTSGWLKKVKEKWHLSQHRINQMVKGAVVAGFAVLSFGNCNSLGLLSNKKSEEMKVFVPERSLSAEGKKPSASVAERSFASYLPQQDDVVIPYPAEASSSLKGNQENYENLVRDLIGQFQENIKTLQNAKTDRRKFYRRQEDLIQKYGKVPHITPQSSCESMSYATFLSVLEKRNSPDDYIAQACKELLLKVPNPHACQSNKKTFSSSYAGNLRRRMEQELQNNQYGIYMIWIKRENGNLHRMTVIGAGNDKAYLMGYNNNCFAKMDIHKMDKLPDQNGYFCDLGQIIKSKANELAIAQAQSLQKKFEQTYFAVLLKEKQQHRF